MVDSPDIHKNTVIFAEEYVEITGPIQLIPTEASAHLNEKKHLWRDERLTSRVLNHWYEMGIINDDRPNGKGWKKFSIAEIVWVNIALTLRAFGVDLKRIKLVRDQLEKYNGPKPTAELAMLDFYIYGLLAYGDTSWNSPVKVMVFESGQVEIAAQDIIDIAYANDGIKEDFISIDLGQLLSRIYADREFKADYLNYNRPRRNPIMEQIEKSLESDDIRSMTIRIKDKEYILDEEFFFDNKSEANALMRMLSYGRKVENKSKGKSTYLVTNKKKITKG